MQDNNLRAPLPPAPVGFPEVPQWRQQRWGKRGHLFRLQQSTDPHHRQTPNPMSALCATTAFCKSTRFASSGFASWFGKLPSKLERERNNLMGNSGSPAAVPKTAGTVSHLIPFPASKATTFNGRIDDRSTRVRR